MTTVPNTVSPGQVVTSAQSNSYRTAIIELQSTKVDRNGDTMAHALYLPSTQDLAATAAIHKSYADGHYLLSATTAGDTMAGPLILPATQSTNPLAAIHTTFADARYVNVTGDTMTGLLTINAAGDECLRLRGVGPYVSFYNEAGTARQGYILASSTEFRLVGEGSTMTFLTDVGGLSERMRLSGAALLLGKTAEDFTTSGTVIFAGGSGSEGSIRSVTGASGAISNILLKHIGTADAAGQYFFVGQRASGTSVATIAQGSGNNTVFDAGSGGSHVTTSDYRLKDEVGPVEDPVGRMMQLAPKHLRWRAESGMVGDFDGFLAHEVEPIVPEAVEGEKDAMWPADSPINPGQIKAQGLDYSKIVTLLTAALQRAFTTIDDLTARVATLEAAA